MPWPPSLLSVLLFFSGIVEPLAQARVDWTDGSLIAVAAAAPELLAPNVDIARAKAERTARQAGMTRLQEAVRCLPAGTGVSIGDAIAANAAIGEKLTAVVGKEAQVLVDYGSDGSARVTFTLALEVVRRVLISAQVLPADGDQAGAQPNGRSPSAVLAVLVDARKVRLSPALAVVLAAGRVRYSGAIVWHQSMSEALADRRLGVRPARTRAVAFSSGTIEVAIDEDALTAIRDSRALVVVVIGARNK
ncbi:MAG: hypothetical protein V2A73_07845 [Pseudomonadota bacterium]